MIPDVTPNGVFYLPPTGWLTSFYNPPTQQIMDLRKQKEKVQSRETNQQAKLHSLDEINKLVELHKYGLVDFDEQLVRRLVEKITIFQRYMEFTFKDGEVIRVNM